MPASGCEDVLLLLSRALTYLRLRSISASNDVQLRTPITVEQ